MGKKLIRVGLAAFIAGLVWVAGGLADEARPVPDTATVLSLGVPVCPDGTERVMVDYDTNGDGDVDVREFATMAGESLAFLFYTSESDLPVRFLVPRPNHTGFEEKSLTEDEFLRAVCSLITPL